MIRLFLAAIAAVLVFMPSALAQQGQLVKPVPATEAGKFIGTNAVIVGKVAEVNKTEKVIRLNFEQKFPKQVFTAVIFAKDFDAFPGMDRLEGKKVEVSGKVEDYRNHPQMILKSHGQLRVLEAEKAAPAAK